jgi:ATP-dependent DNA helicase RecQ
MNIGTNALVAYERGLALLVISTVVEATPHIGRPPSRGFVSAVLVGSVRRDITAVDAHRLSTYGALAAMGSERVLEIVDALIEKGYLETIRGRPMLVCTALGRSLADGHVWRPLGILPGAVDAEKLDLATRSGLVDALRRFRAEQAHTFDVAERLIFSETTLREIATRGPQNADELANVPGVGPKLLERHGAEILRLVAEHDPIIARLSSAGAAR